MRDDVKNVATTERKPHRWRNPTMEAIIGDRYGILDRRPPGE